MDQRVLKDFMVEKLPRLAAHFEQHSIDVSLATFNWFLVVFVESLPSDILLPLWDSFLYEGTKVRVRNPKNSLVLLDFNAQVGVQRSRLIEGSFFETLLQHRMEAGNGRVGSPGQKRGTRG